MDRLISKLHYLIAPMACLALVAGCSPAPESDRGTEQEKNWPTGLAAPIKGATFSLVESHLPGAPRDYRSGTHQGFDFSNGHSGRIMPADTAVVAMADGEIIRIDQDYTDPGNEALEYWAAQSDKPGFVGNYALDQLRGRQVWIRHEQGHISRYAHLSEVHPEFQPGDRVEQGEAIGLMGNTGLPPTDDQPEPVPHLHFELWSPDGSQYLGQDRTPLETHQLVSRVFGPEALPRYARQVVSAVENGEAPPEPYPPQELPDVGFTVDPPSEINAGQAFAVPVTWENDDFRVGDFFALLEGFPLGVINAGDGAWILGAVPMDARTGEFTMTVGSIDPYGRTLMGQRSIEVNDSSSARPDPLEVDARILDRYNTENLETEAQYLHNATAASLSVTDPRWDSAFQAPLEGDVVGGFGQRLVSGPMAPSHPRPGLLIHPDDNSQVHASNAGVVVFSEELPIRGRTVAIAHGGGVISVYAHLDSLQVESDERVSKGQVLGTVGQSGVIERDLLRWEIHVAGIPSDPRSWLDRLLPGR